jgi:hypothetical protein
MIRHMTRAGSMVLLLVAALYPGAAAAHEGTDLEVDPCVRWVGESAVHFNAYQPQYELKAQYGGKLASEPPPGRSSQRRNHAGRGPV